MAQTEQQAGNVIRVRGARVHNLRDIDVDIPRDSLVVLTGVSGSGKSSLAFDTLFAEGQRRYLESLSTYTRQYLNQLERPDVDLIEGLPPTISVDQKSRPGHPRSTLATTTEIYDYLRLLYARAGQAHCTECGLEVSRQSSETIVSQILDFEAGRKVMILAPLVRGRKGAHRRVFERICKDGFIRARVDGGLIDASEPPELASGQSHDIQAVIDRIVVKSGIRARLQESVDLALKHGEGTCLISWQQDDDWHDRLYSEKFSCADCRVSFPDLEPRSFSFSSPYGACPECHGLGVAIEAGEKVIEEDEKVSAVDAEQFEGNALCPLCLGSRLNRFSSLVTFAGVAIHEFTAMPVSEALRFVERVTTVSDLELEVEEGSKADEKHVAVETRHIVDRTIPDVTRRLRFLEKVGLDYLSLDRRTDSISGGEFQRARLASCLGSGLIGACYILDEPTIGLHPRDTSQLISTLEELRDLGNSVIVVEHDEAMMRRSDFLVDLGPGAGCEGGHVVGAGTPNDIAGLAGSPTGAYLAGVDVKPQSRGRAVDWDRSLLLKDVDTHNLKDVTVRIPLDVLVCVTGVSGSGKSSLIFQTLAPAVRAALGGEQLSAENVDSKSVVDQIDRIIEIDQSPIGRSGRSSPATYSGIWDEVRKVFAKTREARLRGFNARRFSFNATQGRCATCRGQGTKRIEMHFMPDMYVRCPECKGARFNRQTLSIRFRGRTVADVLDMRFDEAATFFRNMPKIQTVLDTFCDVGLGYLCLGQSSLTLSGGEAQRVRLATELSRAGRERTLVLLDEPTTGLHAADVNRLMDVLQRMLDRRHSVLVVEHHLAVIAAADWVIDLGPEGGKAGGMVIAEGEPLAITNVAASHTGRALRDFM